MNTLKINPRLFVKKIVGTFDTFYLLRDTGTHQRHAKISVLHEVANNKGRVTSTSHEPTVKLVHKEGARKDINKLTMSASHQVPADHPT